MHFYTQEGSMISHTLHKPLLGQCKARPFNFQGVYFFLYFFISLGEKDNQYKLNKAMANALANFACKILHRIFSM